MMNKEDDRGHIFIIKNGDVGSEWGDGMGEKGRGGGGF